ncbi:MAG: 1-acyl-sn-glycerol-3-phosphate acyltransferase [Firmicutes bacterium]|nr:1-acyl-sn-glycerol-3-phosphate acyltransferase [Bacillota bacterium]
MAKKRKKIKKMKKAPNWMFWILRTLLRPILKCKYNYSFDRSTSKGIKRPCLIVCNHQAGFDQFAVGLGVKFGINFVASDTIFRHGLQSYAMLKLTRPIPITKGTADPVAIKSMMEVAKIGGAVGIFPEGNRCFYGETMTVGKGTGRLAKKLAVPLVIMRLSGVYLTKPRWKIKPNKGKSTGKVVRILSVEELEKLTALEVQEIIEKELYINEFEYNKEQKIKFIGKARAEHLESVLFYCPNCHTFDGLKSEKHSFFCLKCNMKTEIDEYGFFTTYVGAFSERPQIPETILEWSKQQIEYIKNFDFSAFIDKPIFSDNNIEFSKAIKAKKQTDTQKGSIAFYGDRIRVCEQDIYFSDIKALSIQEVRKLTIYTTTDALVIDAPLKYNLMKYMICAYHIKHTQEKKLEYYGY